MDSEAGSRLQPGKHTKIAPFVTRDTSLDRKVALKFLPDVFAGDHERLAVFREYFA
jgi:hypothetical protein